MKRSWKRYDEAGRKVDCEIWFNNYEISMFRIITYYNEGGIERKFRSDFPNDGSQEYREALQKEITCLQEYVSVIETLQLELEGQNVEQNQKLDGWHT